LRLTIYGKTTVQKVLIISVLIDVIAIVIPIFSIKLTLLILSVLLFSFTIYFFRDPKRKLPEGLKGNEIISPADGEIMMIQEIFESDFIHDNVKMIGIFLSPFNVHVNRIPITGNIEYFKYVRGDYIMAFDHKSSERNERTIIGISDGKVKIMFKQIAGFVARRIICNLKQGENVRIGEKFGMIKFGSRVDVIMPLNAVVKVSVKQKVKAGETIIAEIPF
jgi:phosphatidylserine decarboxylase